MLVGEILRDRKHSHSISDELLLNLFTQQTPTPVRTITTAKDKISADKAAEVSVCILDLTQSNINAVSDTSSTTDAQTPSARDMLIRKFSPYDKKPYNFGVQEVFLRVVISNVSVLNFVRGILNIIGINIKFEDKQKKNPATLFIFRKEEA